MFRAHRVLPALAAVTLLLVPGCAAFQQLNALRTVAFAFAGVSEVRIAGVRLGPASSFASLGLADAARITAALLARQVPLDLIAHVGATNPPENKVAARMVQLGWTLFIEDRQVLAGRVQDAVTIAPGATVDVPLSVRIELLELGSGGARDLFDLALAIAGQGAVQKDLRFELVPTIETSLGSIAYPAPVVVRRAGTTS